MNLAKQCQSEKWIKFPFFRKLENPGYFSLASVDYGNVVWPGDIDIAPETLFVKGVSETNGAEVK